MATRRRSLVFVSAGSMCLLFVLFSLIKLGSRNLLCKYLYNLNFLRSFIVRNMHELNLHRVFWHVNVCACYWHSAVGLLFWLILSVSNAQISSYIHLCSTRLWPQNYAKSWTWDKVLLCVIICHFECLCYCAARGLLCWMTLAAWTALIKVFHFL